MKKQPWLALWIRRLNAIGSLPRDERDALEAACGQLGHVPSGEMFLTADPIHVCIGCAAEFHLEEDDRNN